MKIFLVGFMGCGKTTLGNKLASKLKYKFIDLDKTLESVAGMTIAEYFKTYDEGKFREFEKQILQKTEFPRDVIISTGGGVPCYFDNMEWMNSNGTTVYISMPPGALAARLRNGRTERPLLKDLSEEEIIDFITAKLEEREPYYTKAHFIINGVDITPEKVIKALKLT